MAAEYRYVINRKQFRTRSCFVSEPLKKTFRFLGILSPKSNLHTYHNTEINRINRMCSSLETVKKPKPSKAAKPAVMLGSQCRPTTGVKHKHPCLQAPRHTARSPCSHVWPLEQMTELSMWTEGVCCVLPKLGP